MTPDPAEVKEAALGLNHSNHRQYLRQRKSVSESPGGCVQERTGYRRFSLRNNCYAMADEQLDQIERASAESQRRLKELDDVRKFNISRKSIAAILFHQRLGQVEALLTGAGGADEVRNYKLALLEKLRGLITRMFWRYSKIFTSFGTTPDALIDLRITMGADARKFASLEEKNKKVCGERVHTFLLPHISLSSSFPFLFFLSNLPHSTYHLSLHRSNGRTPILFSQLAEENELLKKEVGHLKYQVKMLVRSLNEEEKKHTSH